MRVIIFLILFLTSPLVKAQSNLLFKIISCSEGVTLDGVEVKPGLIVYDNSIKLEIPKKGYAGVITIEGYAHKLGKSIKVKSINGAAKYSNRESKPFWGGATYRMDDFTIIGAPSNQFAQILGDSVFFLFKSNYNKNPPFIGIFSNMFDDVLLSDTIKSNWKIFGVGDLLKKEGAILFTIESNKYRSERILIKRSEKLNANLNLDLAGIQNDLIAKLAIYEISKLYYDHLFQLYKIETTKNLNLDPISAAYLAKRREKYQLDQYNLK